MPVNKIPPETLALVATFFDPGPQLINATAVCKYWRTTLVSSPRLWSRIICPNRSMFETYLRRSKYAPLEVRLRSTFLQFLELLIPHISRLSSLTIVMYDSSGFVQLARLLESPIPALNEFGIIAAVGAGKLTVPPGTGNHHFLHVKKLHLEQVSSLRAPRAFQHVTELVWIVKSDDSTSPSSLLDALVELPVLERAEIVFRGLYGHPPIVPPTRLIALPHVQRMALRCSDGEIPNLLEFLELPSLTSLVVDQVPISLGSFPILPVSSFNESLPNFTQLPEMGIRTCYQYSEVSFRGPSQATLDYHSEPPALGNQPYHHDRKRWGGLPLDSVRKLVVDLGAWTHDLEDLWVVSLLRDLGSLEHLEFRGCCGYILRYLRRMVMGGITFTSMKTLTVRSGFEYEMRQAYRLKGVVDELGLGISVTWIEDRKIPGSKQHDPEDDGGSEIWDWNSKTEPVQE